MITEKVPESPIAAMTDYSSTYVDKTIETLSKASTSFELDKLAQEMGMGDVFKQLSKDRLKVLFAGLGAFYLMTLIKRNLVTVGVLAGGAVLAYKNKDYLKTLLNKQSYLESKIPIEHEEPQAPVVLIDSNVAPIMNVVEQDIASEDKLI